MDTSIGTVIAEKIKDFAEEGIPEVFDRDLSLGRIQPPARGNLVNVIVGVRRCGKTYRLYQEMHRIVAEGYPQDSILQFRGRATEALREGAAAGGHRGFLCTQPPRAARGCFLLLR